MTLIPSAGPLNEPFTATVRKSAIHAATGRIEAEVVPGWGAALFTLPSDPYAGSIASL